jgi:hypothetical protein
VDFAAMIDAPYGHQQRLCRRNVSHEISGRSAFYWNGRLLCGAAIVAGSPLRARVKSARIETPCWPLVA